MGDISTWYLQSITLPVVEGSSGCLLFLDTKGSFTVKVDACFFLN